MLKKITFLLFIFIFAGCDQQSEREQKIEAVNADFQTIRFDQEFAEATAQNWQNLKEKYPFLFPAQYADSVWVNKLSDTIQQEIDTEVTKEFADFSVINDELHDLFQHSKYYFPDFQVPDVITVTSEVDYKNKVIYTGDYLFISLDTYLGEDHKFYVGVQEFLKKNFRKEQIVPDAASEIAKNYVDFPEARTFLAHMVYYGKLLYLKDLLIPAVPEHERMGYTAEELDWAEANEEQIWRFFVENEIIFDSDSELYTRFLYPGPFSKFYLALDSESPDRLGQFIGRNMVRAYMEKNDVSIDKMLNTSAEELFNDANYKPKK